MAGTYKETIAAYRPINREKTDFKRQTELAMHTLKHKYGVTDEEIFREVVKILRSKRHVEKCDKVAHEQGFDSFDWLFCFHEGLMRKDYSYCRLCITCLHERRYKKPRNV